MPYWTATKFYLIGLCFISAHVQAADEWRDLQTQAALTGKAAFGHWGPNPEKYSTWTSHSNRLIPVYTFGIELDSIRAGKSVYRNESRLRELYGQLPAATLNPKAEYFDQTDIYHLQNMAASAGKKYIILLIFDGMDWQLMQAGALAKSGTFTQNGRGAGLCFLDYRGAPVDYGFMVTSPYCGEGTKCDVDLQQVVSLAEQRGGYDAVLGGATPWSTPTDADYLIGNSKVRDHAFTDSASSATSMTTGIKTYNESINVDPLGHQYETVAHHLQASGYSIGIVTSVPISHATPAAAYAHNVSRDDFQDLTRDLVGLPSVAHFNQPLPGVDVLLGAGWGDQKTQDAGQGQNFIAGNTYVAVEDLAKIDAENSGLYEIVIRRKNVNGRELLMSSVERAVSQKRRLFGIFGYHSGHLPFRTADDRYDPTVSASKNGSVQAEKYTSTDLLENPTLADMTSAALQVLQSRGDRFWLMVEAGDVDWAAHDNNIDNAAGAIISGDEAFQTIVTWLESKNAWNDAVVIVTSDHGHYFVWEHPELLHKAE